MQQLDGRVAVVTGAASGIGRALAAALGVRGCRVALADIEAGALDDTRRELEATGIDCSAIVTDVSDAGSVRRLRNAVLERFGAVHVLCNNAGVSRRGPISDVSLDDWAWTLGVNLWGVIHGLDAFLDVLVAQDEAHVVNTASVAGLLAYPLGGPYNASKHAVVGLTETLHHELQATAPHVGVTLVCPGATRTRIATAGRNRPPRFGGPDPGVTTLADGDPRTALARVLAESGRAPADVAAMVIAAIEQRTYVVLTHHAEYADAIRERTHSMLAGRAPPTPELPGLIHGTS